MALLLCWTTGCASLPANTQRRASSAFSQPGQTPLGQLTEARRTQARARGDSAFRILDDVDLALSTRLALVDAATRSLDLQYYAIHADPTTEVILQKLRAAARRGVRVRVLLDDFNSVGEDAQVLRLAFEPNIELRLFNPLTGPRNNMISRIIGSLHDLGRLQKRMHNKLFIADSAWGVTGGRNLGDRYFGGGDTQNFVDLDVLAAGRIVRDMAASFDRFWNDELAYPVESLLDKNELDALRKPVTADESPPAPTLPASATATGTSTGTVLPNVTAEEARQADRPALDLRTVELTWAPSTLLVDAPGKIGPGDDEVDASDTVIDGLLSLMQQAQHEVTIVSPYFVPGASMMAVYRQLRARGVRVRVLTNSLAANDAPAAHAGYARYRDELLALGIELHEMRSDPAVLTDQLGSSGRTERKKGGSGFGSGISGPGGSKATTRSRASLHSKAVFIDQRLAVIGSMNLDLRSRLKNSEVGLVIRSGGFTRHAQQLVEKTLAKAAWRLEMHQGRLAWRAPPGAGFTDGFDEPGASTGLKLLVKLIGPFAPDEML